MTERLAWLLVVGCGPIELERHDATPITEVDPNGLCQHFVSEVEIDCDETFPTLTCVEECVAEGGSEVGMFLDFEDCWHDEVDITCASLEACLLEVGATCVGTR